MRFKQFLNESASLTTTLQESLHCVALGIIQLNKTILDESLLLNGELFTKSFDTYCNVDIGNDTLYKFTQENPSWVTSVINNANILKKSGFLKSNNYTFYRTNGIMKNVYSTASLLLKKEGIRLNADKWNPGDIWASTLNSIPSFDNIYEYNEWIAKSLKKGSLVGISLKKSSNPKVVYINQTDEKQTLSYKGTKKPKTPFNTGIVILTGDPKISLNVRSFRISNASAITSELAIKGSKARHGKTSLTKYVKKYNIPWATVNDLKKHVDDLDYMKNMIIDLWKGNGFSFSQSVIDKEWQKRLEEKQFNRNPLGYFRSIINSLQFGEYLKKNENIADEILTDIYRIGSSMSEYSSDFIKVY
jgi:hypothetical protein